MDLVFNKVEGQGTAELKKHLGFIDAGLIYINLERFLKIATREIITLIGETAYVAIQGYYASDSEAPEQIELLEELQFCIAIEAYRNYVPSKDVGHTQNGRRMRMEEYEKQAFEWMIDRDNANMERMYYRSLDHLLAFMEGLAGWSDSDNYKKIKQLFVNSTDDFEDYFSIGNSRLLLLKLSPGLRQFEKQQLIPRITKQKYAELKADETTDEPIMLMIKEASVYWSLYWAFSGRLSVRLFPEGIEQRITSDRTTTKGSQVPALNETAWASQQFKGDAEKILIEIENYLAPAPIIVSGEVDVMPGLGFSSDDNFATT